MKSLNVEPNYHIRVHSAQSKTPQQVPPQQDHRHKNGQELTPLVTLLAVYFNCAYYTLQCPFRLEYECSSGLIITKYNRYLRTVYFMVATAAELIIFYDSVILDSPTFSWMPQSSEGSVQTVFNTITNFTWFLSNSLVKWELWHAPGKIEQILMLLMRLEKNLRFEKCKYFGALKYPSFFALFVYTHMTAFGIWESSTALWNGNSTSVYCVRDSNYQIVLESAVLTSTFYENQVLQVSSKLVPLIALVFASIAYSVSLNPEDYDNAEATEKLVLVTEISVRIKLCFGVTIAASCFCQLPYVAQYLLNLFESSWSQMCQYSYYFSLLLIQLWLGSIAHLKLSSMNYLSDTIEAPGCSKYDIIPINEAKRNRNLRTLMVDACNRNSIGVRGHFMTFTYSFFGNITVWMLAYAVTVIQFQSMQDPCISSPLFHV